ncbi:MAG: nucleotide exchange factor GrpE [Bacillota bacterium]|nr:nucleotide exchange factor GrpE [Bacillota bacterium]
MEEYDGVQNLKRLISKSDRNDRKTDELPSQNEIEKERERIRIEFSCRAGAMSMFLPTSSSKSREEKFESSGITPVNANKSTENQDIWMQTVKVNGILTRLRSILVLEILIDYQAQLKEMRVCLSKYGHDNWRKEISKLLDWSTKTALDFINRGDVKVEESRQQEFIDELLNLTPLEQFYLRDGEIVEMDGDLASLLGTLMADIKKGNRANFRGFQELESRFELLAEQVQTDKQESVNKYVQEMKNKNADLKNFLLEMFDQIDSIYQAVLQLGNDDVTKQVKLVVNKSLATLEALGFEEIKVLGEFIDGKTMISLGNVSRLQYAPHLEQYQVYSVTKRGFRDNETKEIIRKATVITVD